MRKFTDEQLSRVLSCAATGNLGRVGCPASTSQVVYEQRGQNACLIQAALATWEGYSSYEELPKKYYDHANWFDNDIWKSEIVADPDKLLAKLEEVGIA